MQARRSYGEFSKHTPNAYSQWLKLGYVPTQTKVNADGSVTSIGPGGGSTTPVPGVGSTTTYFGAGPPSTTYNDGDIYFDTTYQEYQAWVQNSGAWYVSDGAADWLDIRTYGAVSGSSGAAAAFNAALGALPVGGGTIYIPAGSWIWEETATVTGNNVSVIVNNGAEITRSGAWSFITLLGTYGEILGGNWNGNYPTVSSVSPALQIGGAYNRIANTYVHDVSSVGIVLDGSASTCNRNIVENNYVYNTQSIGISQHTATECIIRNNRVDTTYLEGITIDIGSHRAIVDGNTLNNTCTGGGVGGIGIDDSDYWIVADNIIRSVDGSLAGIKTQNNVGACHYGIIQGNQIYSTAYGVWIHNGSSGVTNYCTITGNNFQNNGGTAVLIDASCVGNLVGPNQLNGQAVTDNGTSTLIVVPMQQTITTHGVVVSAGNTANKTTAVGATNTVLHGNTGADPSYSAVDLAADVTGNLPVANLDSGTSASSTTYWRGDGTWDTPSGAGNVVGPGSSTAGDVAIYADTSGELLEDTGLVAADIVLGPASATSGNLAVFDGTSGKLVKDGGPVSSGGGGWLPLFFPGSPPILVGDGNGNIIPTPYSP